MKFLVDCMLGKLAKELRMLGYDAIYYQKEDPYPLIKMARQEGRIILTRNTKLIPRRSEDQIVCIKEDQPALQLKELIQKGYVLVNEHFLFTRCLLCNKPLDEIPLKEAEGKVPDYILYQQKEFYRCPQCLKIYWQGSHKARMQKRVEELLASAHPRSTNQES